MVTRNHARVVASLDELKAAGLEIAQEIQTDVSTAHTMRDTSAANQISNLDSSGARSNYVWAVFVPIPAAVMDQDGATRAARFLGPAVPLELGLFVPEWVILAQWFE